MSTRKTEKDNKQEDTAHAINKLLIGTGLRVSPDQNDQYALTISGISPKDLTNFISLNLQHIRRDSECQDLIDQLVMIQP
jgi:hypothetical protein